MFCTKCGSQLADTAKFCTTCGEPTAVHPSGQTLSPMPTGQAFAPVANTQINSYVRIPRQAPNQSSKMPIVAMVLGIASFVLLLVFTPFVYSAFRNMSITLTDEEVVLMIITAFLYVIFKALAAFLEGLVSVSLFLLPCVSLGVAGLTVAIVSCAKNKGCKSNKAALFVNIGALVAQFMVVAACIGLSGDITIN